MNVQIGDLILGEGRTKICLPVVGKNDKEVVQQLDKAVSENPDLLEFRADWYAQWQNPDLLEELIQKIGSKKGTIPLLFTFRTSREGGESAISFSRYKQLLLEVAESVDAIDVEVFMNEDREQQDNGVQDWKVQEDTQMVELIRQLHEKKCKVIASNHHFTNTPSNREMLQRLCAMQNMGADVAKLAVMPQIPADVLRLLEVTDEMRREHTATPVITMSMGKLGAVSRLAGGIFGSALTFACAGTASAPGQMEIDALRRGMKLL